jgi:DNA-binding CsgD family transcriptional regulator
MDVDAGGTAIGDRVPWTLVVGASLVIWVLWLAELAAPSTVSLGELVILPVVAASLLLDARHAWVVAGMAAASRVAAWLIGDIAAGLAVLEVISFGVVTVVAIQVRSSRRVHPVDQMPVAAPAPSQQATFTNLWDSVRLTERERQVLEMAVQGLTAKQVAARLHISRRTVESHLDHAYSKLGVRSKRDVIERLYDAQRSGAAG